MGTYTYNYVYLQKKLQEGVNFFTNLQVNKQKFMRNELLLIFNRDSITTPFLKQFSKKSLYFPKLTINSMLKKRDRKQLTTNPLLLSTHTCESLMSSFNYVLSLTNIIFK